jgi:hypothetical protein
MKFALIEGRWQELHSVTAGSQVATQGMSIPHNVHINTTNNC